MTEALKMTVYKQIPGADIEPGWWAIVHPAWRNARISVPGLSTGASDRWLGPHRNRREAERAARQVIAATK